MVNWKRVIFLCLLFLLWYTWPTEGKDAISAPISLDVYPRKLICPLGKTADVRVRVRIARHADNRLRSLSWASLSGVSGSQTHQMEGEADAVTFERLITVSSGPYLFKACVIRVVGEQEKKAQQHCVTQEIEVI